MNKNELEKAVTTGQAKLDMMWASMVDERLRLLGPLLRLAKTGTPLTNEEMRTVGMCAAIVGLELDTRDARRELDDS